MARHNVAEVDRLTVVAHTASKRLVCQEQRRIEIDKAEAALASRKARRHRHRQRRLDHATDHQPEATRTRHRRDIECLDHATLHQFDIDIIDDPISGEAQHIGRTGGALICGGWRTTEARQFTQAVELVLAHWLLEQRGHNAPRVQQRHQLHGIIGCHAAVTIEDQRRAGGRSDDRGNTLDILGYTRTTDLDLDHRDATRANVARCHSRLFDGAGGDGHVGDQRCTRAAKEHPQWHTLRTRERIEHGSLHRAARAADRVCSAQCRSDRAPLAGIRAFERAACGVDRCARHGLCLAIERSEGRGLTVATCAVGEFNRDEQVLREILRATGDAKGLVERDVQILDGEAADSQRRHAVLPGYAVDGDQYTAWAWAARAPARTVAPRARPMYDRGGGLQ